MGTHKEMLVEIDTKTGNLEWTKYAEDLCKNDPSCVGILARRLIYEYERDRRED